MLPLATSPDYRVSELIGLTCGDVQLGVGAHLNCLGKGRKQRIARLTTQTVAVLRAWLADRRASATSPWAARRVRARGLAARSVLRQRALRPRPQRLHRIPAQGRAATTADPLREHDHLHRARRSDRTTRPRPRRRSPRSAGSVIGGETNRRPSERKASEEHPPTPQERGPRTGAPMVASVSARTAKSVVRARPISWRAPSRLGSARAARRSRTRGSS